PGLHPTGAALTWSGGRGPDTASVSELPGVSEDQISAFLRACAPLVGATAPSEASPHPATTVPPGFETVPDYIKAKGGTNELSAGIEPRDWFKLLTPKEQAELVRACLDKLDNRTADPRDDWLDILFAVAHAE